jgi:cytochrome c oxidase cbb3-type subunit 1
LDIAITLVWVCYIVVYVETVRRRSQPHIYVANWFFMAFIACGRPAAHFQ